MIRDYGTHLITKAKVGAVVEKLDFIDERTAASNETTLEEFKAAAAVSFTGFFSASASASIASQVREETIKRLFQITKHSQMNTIGGPSVNRILANDNSTVRCTKGPYPVRASVKPCTAGPRPGGPGR